MKFWVLQPPGVHVTEPPPHPTPWAAEGMGNGEPSPSPTPRVPEVPVASIAARQRPLLARPEAGEPLHQAILQFSKELLITHDVPGTVLTNGALRLCENRPNTSTGAI